MRIILFKIDTKAFRIVVPALTAGTLRDLVGHRGGE